jgi:hypothetical protein
MASRVEGAAVKLVQGILGPAYGEHCFAALDSGEWAISFVAKDGGNDRRFRYTRGRLLDEQHIGDARAA